MSFFQIANSSGAICSNQTNPNPNQTALKNFEDQAYKFAKENLAVVRVVKAEEKTSKVFVYQVLGLSELVSAMFFVLIMYFGFSFMNLFEAVYLFITGLCC